MPQAVALSNIIQTLINEYNNIQNIGIKVGVIGPRAINRQTRQKYHSPNEKHITDNTTEISALISSASLIKVTTFTDVGKMNAELFIDGVDYEWCWRAKHNGYRFFIIESILLNHKLGEGDKNFLWEK